MGKIKTSAGKNSYRWDYNELRYLVHVLEQTKDFAGILNLFIDLHTPKEISEIIRRVLIASMIINGDTYEEIFSATGASSTTIAKIGNKMARQKSVLQATINKAGGYDKFAGSRHSDPAQRRIDRLLTKIGFGRTN